MNPGENMHVLWHHIRLRGLLSNPQTPTICLTDPLAVGPAQLTPATQPISGTECSVHWAMFRKKRAPVNICSPPANHNRAPWGSTVAAKIPQGHGGKSVSPKQVRLFTGTLSLGWALDHRVWDKLNSLVLLNISVVGACRVPSNYQAKEVLCRNTTSWDSLMTIKRPTQVYITYGKFLFSINSREG